MRGQPEGTGCLAKQTQFHSGGIDSIDTARRASRTLPSRIRFGALPPEIASPVVLPPLEFIGALVGLAIEEFFSFPDWWL
jgi:hypothetical protein